MRINWPRVALVGLATASLVALVGMATVSLAVLVADRFRAVTSPTAAAISGEHRLADRASAAPRRAPTLRVVTQTAPGRPGRRLPLGIAIRGPRAGAAVEITGLPPGSSLSSGRRFGDTGWRVAVASLADVMIRPPHGFADTIDLAVELRRADDTLVERRSVRRVWSPLANAETAARPTQAADAQAAAATATPESAKIGTGPAAVPRSDELDAEQIALFMRRAEILLSLGEVSGARIMLERAARAGNARAAMLLGGTYDPTWPSQLGPRRPATDQALARAWYERARDLGASDARQRLDALARGEPGSDLPSRP